MTKEDIKALAIGGVVLGDGRGWYEEGIRDGVLALDIGEVRPLGPEEAPDGMLVAVSAGLRAPN